MQRGNFQGWKE